MNLALHTTSPAALQRAAEAHAEKTADRFDGDEYETIPGKLGDLDVQIVFVEIVPGRGILQGCEIGDTYVDAFNFAPSVEREWERLIRRHLDRKADEVREAGRD